MSLKNEVVNLQDTIFSIVDGRVKMLDLFYNNQWMDLDYDKVEALHVISGNLYLLREGSVYWVDKRFKLHQHPYHKPFKKFLNDSTVLTLETIDGVRVEYDVIEGRWKPLCSAGAEIAVIPVFNREVAIRPRPKETALVKLYSLVYDYTPPTFNDLTESVSSSFKDFTFKASDGIVSGMKSLVGNFLKDEPTSLVNDEEIVRESIKEKAKIEDIDLVTAVIDMFGEKKPEPTYKETKEDKSRFSFKSLFEDYDEI